MLKRTPLALLIAFSFMVPATAQTTPPQTMRLMRQPDIHGDSVVFTYANDIWKVNAQGGEAQRLSIRNGRESSPHFSPDGQRIAMTAEANGGQNVFVMPAAGGPLTQLTWGSDVSRVVGWSKDGQSVLFTTSRGTSHGFYSKIYQVSLAGGQPTPLPVDTGSALSFSPDGKQFVFNRHPMYFWWWKRYKGSLNHDIWLHDGQSYSQLTQYEGNDSWPMWGADDTLYFVSDRTGIANLHSYNLKTRQIQQLSDHKSDGVQWPGLDESGRKVVYENDGRLFLYEQGQKSREIPIYANEQAKHDYLRYEQLLPYLDNAAISPSGQRASISARGEIFSVPLENGDTRNLSQTSSSREHSPQWSPSGKWIAFVSDHSGEEEIYIQDHLNQRAARQLTKSGHFKEGLTWSPDSQKILFQRNDYRLYLLDLKSGKETLIEQTPNWGYDDYAWSPDSNWVVFTRSENNGFRHLFIYDLDSKKIQRVTQSAHNHFSPSFSLDGKHLFFLRDVYPGREDESVVAPTVEVMAMSLQSEAREPFKKPENEALIARPKRKPQKKTRKKISIDFKGISGRVRALDMPPGPYDSLSAGNGEVYFMRKRAVVDTSQDNWWRQLGEGQLQAFNLKSQKIRPLSNAIMGYQLAARKQHILMAGPQGLRIISAQRPTPPNKGYLDLSKVIMQVDLRQEWRQIFDESWRRVREEFYDPNFHGVDWAAVKKYYAQFLPHIRSRHELNILLEEMVGELNASHQGARGGDLLYNRKYPVATLGAELKVDPKSNLYRFSHIYKGDNSDARYRSPLDQDYVKIKEGDYLLAINGRKITGEDNLNRFLVMQHLNSMQLLTNSRPQFQGAQLTRIDPRQGDAPLRYKAWLDGNRQRVKQASQGKIGYLHLPDMSMSSLNIFNQFFVENIDKEGLIIDVRYNGGGSIDTQLIDKLERRQYFSMKTRNSRTESWPGNDFNGKVVVLINEYAFSDGEVFPRGMQVRNLGTIIGTPTLGYVIAVHPHRLIDGGVIRQSFIGLWDRQGKMLESKGAQPDIRVDNPPEEALLGIDRQLESALGYLIEEIKKNPRQDWPTPYTPR